jgi:elongator complex protein 3
MGLTVAFCLIMCFSTDMKQIIDDNLRLAITEILKLKIRDDKELMKAKRQVAKKYKTQIPSNTAMIEVYRELVARKIIKKSEKQEMLLMKRAVRTMSGIAPVAVLTKPFGCPGKCAYCPTEKDVPQSYLSNEPAVMRAIRCGYNPYIQVQDRLRALVNNGHNPTKIELIVIGGTWSYFPNKYKYWYVLNCFAAANQFKNFEGNKFKEKYKISHYSVGELKELLLKEQKKNERAKYQIIGLTLETRPDYIDKKEVLQMRELGCTRVELGVQAIDDGILKKNRRGHGVKEITDATRLLRNYGFKITYHLMPGLPGMTPAKDLTMFKQYFNDERFQPDQIKFYPTVVTRGSLLYRWWKNGKYKPYTDKQLQNLIINCKKLVPRYVRIIRLIRDIPGESIVAGNKVTNLRQIMKDKGVECECIRCREVKEQEIRDKRYELRIEKYSASNGDEYFISFNDKASDKLLGFCRLRLSKDNIWNSAIIRELHVYGSLVSVGSKKKVQHSGLGKRLMQEAEKIARKNNYKKMTIISGIGVRSYYRKLGYKLRDTYMIKSF